MAQRGAALAAHALIDAITVSDRDWPAQEVPLTDPVRFAAIGIDHRHVYGMAATWGRPPARNSSAGSDPKARRTPSDGFSCAVPRCAPRPARAEDCWTYPTTDLILLSGIRVTGRGAVAPCTRART